MIKEEMGVSGVANSSSGGDESVGRVEAVRWNFPCACGPGAEGPSSSTARCYWAVRASRRLLIGASLVLLHYIKDLLHLEDVVL